MNGNHPTNSFERTPNGLWVIDARRAQTKGKNRHFYVDLDEPTETRIRAQHRHSTGVKVQRLPIVCSVSPIFDRLANVRRKATVKTRVHKSWTTELNPNHCGTTKPNQRKLKVQFDRVQSETIEETVDIGCFSSRRNRHDDCWTRTISEE